MRVFVSECEMLLYFLNEPDRKPAKILLLVILSLSGTYFSF